MGHGVQARAQACVQPHGAQLHLKHGAWLPSLHVPELTWRLATILPPYLNARVVRAKGEAPRYVQAREDGARQQSGPPKDRSVLPPPVAGQVAVARTCARPGLVTQASTALASLPRLQLRARWSPARPATHLGRTAIKIRVSMMLV